MRQYYFFLCVFSLFAVYVHLAPTTSNETVITTIVPSTNVVNCNELLQIADQGMNKIMFIGDQNRTSFSSKDDLKENYCGPFIGYLKEVSDYSKCLKAFSKSMLNIILSNVKRIHKSICANDVKLNEAFEHVKCMTQETKQSMVAVVNIAVSMVTEASKLQDVDDIIPGLCCGSLEYFDRMEVMANEICLTRTGPETSKYIGSLIRNIFADAIDIMCGKYPTAKECEALKPQLFEQMKNSMNQSTPVNSSFALPLVNLVKRLDGLTI